MRKALMVLGVAFLLVTPSAGAKVTPHRTASAHQITVTWRTDRALKQGWHYDVWVSTFKHARGCHSGGIARTSRQAKRLVTVKVTFKAKAQWCNGRGYYGIDLVRDRDGASGPNLATVAFTNKTFASTG